MSTDSFRDCVLEQLFALDDLRCKRMFGVHDPYFGEDFFGAMFDGQLYFKTNPDTLPDYLAFCSAAPASSKKPVSQNYREVLAYIIEDAGKLTTQTQMAVRS